MDQVMQAWRDALRVPYWRVACTASAYCPLACTNFRTLIAGIALCTLHMTRQLLSRVNSMQSGSSSLAASDITVLCHSDIICNKTALSAGTPSTRLRPAGLGGDGRVQLLQQQHEVLGLLRALLLLLLPLLLLLLGLFVCGNNALPHTETCLGQRRAFALLRQRQRRPWTTCPSPCPTRLCIGLSRSSSLDVH